MKNGNMMKDSMKLRALSFAVLLTGCLSSCVREAGAPVLKPAGEEMVFTARWAEGQGSRTVVMENGMEIWWTPAESIHIFYGDASAQFTSVNKDTVACTSFYGILGVATGTMEQESSPRPFIGVYPYRESNSYDGESVSIEVAYEQQACAGTFADKFFPAVARSTSLDLAFYNVCGGVRFSIVHEGVNRVVFHSLDSCSMAGKVKVGFDDDNKPLILQCTESVDSVVVYAPEGGFIPGKNYYAAFIPQEHAKGISVSLYAGLKKAYGEIAHPICVKRSVFGIRDAIDESWKYVRQDAIKFADEEVKRICVEHFDLDGDEELIPEELEAAKSIGTFFKDNAEIRFFNELAYFTGLSAIEPAAFGNCANLEEVVLPDSLVTIGASAFAGCTSLRKIDLSACTLLTSIGDSAFKDATSEDISVPSSVTSIGSKALAPFKYVKLNCVVPPVFQEDSFHADVRFGVPQESLSEYKRKATSSNPNPWYVYVFRIYSLDTFVYPPRLETVSASLKTLNIYGAKINFVKVNAGHYSNSKSATVTLTKEYWIATTELTREIWIAVMDNDPSYFKPTMEVGLRCPVTKVTWEDVSTFLAALNALVPGNFRLPTEAQWEYAALGGRSSSSYTYSGSNSINAVAWYIDNSRCCLDLNGATREQPHPAASLAANGLGLYDMSGNVNEWVNDWYSATAPGGTSGETDPVGPAKDTQNRRVIRGGSYSSPASSCAVFYRTARKQTEEAGNLGFRLAM